MNAPEGTIRRGRKFDQVIEGAREVFLQDGFEGASVDMIAKAAGVSKATLYSYFPDKRLLFIEIASIECLRLSDDALDEVNADCPVEDMLYEAASRMMSFFLSEIGRGLFRIIVAETDRFPELGQTFWDNGPARGKQVLRGFFSRAVAKGELQIDDLDLAADQFVQLCKADLHPKMIMGVQREFTQEQRHRVARGAVEMFMARYGVRQTSDRQLTTA